MGVNSAIREIAVDAARRVVREELKQLETALEAGRTPQPGPEPLLTVEDVARLCRVTPKTVQRWILKGLLRATRNPGMREYPLSARAYSLLAAGGASRVIAAGLDERARPHTGVYACDRERSRAERSKSAGSTRRDGQSPW